jgi:hypothetical protein
MTVTAPARKGPAPRGGKTPQIVARVPPELLNAAKNAHPELNDADNSLLVRVALAILAGFTVKTALDYLGQPKPGHRIRVPENTA